MKNHTTSTLRKKAPRFFGWRIRLHFPGRPSQDMPIIWAEKVPCLWGQLQASPDVQAATIYRSGRKVDTFQRAGGQQ